MRNCLKNQQLFKHDKVGHFIVYIRAKGVKLVLSNFFCKSTEMCRKKKFFNISRYFYYDELIRQQSNSTIN